MFIGKWSNLCDLHLSKLLFFLCTFYFLQFTSVWSTTDFLPHSKEQNTYSWESIILRLTFNAPYCLVFLQIDPITFQTSILGWLFCRSCEQSRRLIIWTRRTPSSNINLFCSRKKLQALIFLLLVANIRVLTMATKLRRLFSASSTHGVLLKNLPVSFFSCRSLCVSSTEYTTVTASPCDGWESLCNFLCLFSSSSCRAHQVFVEMSLL